MPVFCDSFRRSVAIRPIMIAGIRQVMPPFAETPARHLGLVETPVVATRSVSSAICRSDGDWFMAAICPIHSFEFRFHRPAPATMFHHHIQPPSAEPSKQPSPKPARLFGMAERFNQRQPSVIDRRVG